MGSVIMPTYVYRCTDCNHRFERVHSMFLDRPIPCPECSGENTERIIQAPAIVMDWNATQSIHESKRFRPAAANRALGGST